MLEQGQGLLMAQAPSPAEGKSSGALVLERDMKGEEGLLSCSAAIHCGQRLSNTEASDLVRNVWLTATCLLQSSNDAARLQAVDCLWWFR